MQYVDKNDLLEDSKNVNSSPSNPVSKIKPKVDLVIIKDKNINEEQKIDTNIINLLPNLSASIPPNTPMVQDKSGAIPNITPVILIDLCSELIKYIGKYGIVINIPTLMTKQQKKYKDNICILFIFIGNICIKIYL